MRGAFLPSQSLEAQYILRYILCLKQQHNLRWDDFAILCRTNSALIELQSLLANPRIQQAACTASPLFATDAAHGSAEAKKHTSDVGDPNAPIDPACLFPEVNLSALELPAGGLPMASTSSTKSGGAEIFLRPDAVDLLSYLRLAVDPHHDASFMRVVNRPPRRVGGKTLLALKRVQTSLANRSPNEPEKPRGGMEMPWHELPGDGQRSRGASLFEAMCSLLRAAGMNAEIPDIHLADDSAVELEARRLRTAQMESLASFSQAIHRLCSMSRTSASVSEMLEYILGALRLGNFFAERRQAQRCRAAALRVAEETEGRGAEKVVPAIDSAVAPLKSLTATCRRREPSRRKRKADCADGTEDADNSARARQESVDSLRDLSKLYGAETFADVLGLLRSVEAYAPNWQQVTAADCILRLLRDAGSGRFVQQKVNNAVTLSTIHQAKGLEWQAVIVARANDGYRFRWC